METKEVKIGTIEGLKIKVKQAFPVQGKEYKRYHVNVLETNAVNIFEEGEGFKLSNSLDFVLFTTKAMEKGSLYYIGECDLSITDMRGGKIYRLRPLSPIEDIDQEADNNTGDDSNLIEVMTTSYNVDGKKYLLKIYEIK
jgi:hypothetical protein